jgi:crossover junction endodeoxyribonuclease RuvC
MIVLGIDPGIGRCGWGVISHEKGKSHAIAFGCIGTSPRVEPPQRLLALREDLVKILDKYKPEVVGVEELFFGTNTKTAFVVGEARGVIVEVIASRKIPMHSFNPLQVKLAVTGYGKADKTQIGTMIKMLLGLKEVPKPDDTADALAVALATAVTKKY